MGLLAVAVIALAALGLLNLLLTLAVIRRLRVHTELLSTRSEMSEGSVIAVGERPEEFAAVDITGMPVPADGPRLVGFFSPDCKPCKETLPTFVAHAAGYPQGRSRVLAVVAGDGPGVVDFTGELTPVSQVVVESPDGPVNKAFQVNGYPAWCVLDEHGVVQHSGVGLHDMPVLTAR
jgi:thiol-disulfide isomerase/thioredoxin